MAYMGPTPDFNTVLCVWAGVDMDGNPITGDVALTYNSPTPLLDDDATLPVGIYPTTIVRTLSTTTIMAEGEGGVMTPRTVGYATFRVPASNDPDIAGSGGTYTLNERLNNATGVTRIFVADRDAGTIYLNRLSSVGAVEGTPLSVLTISQFNALAARVTTLETSGVGGGALTDGSVTNAKVSATAAIALSKTVDSTGSGGRLAMTTAERTQLANAPADTNAALAGKATLTSGKVPIAQIPDLTAVKVTDFQAAVDLAVATRMTHTPYVLYFNSGTRAFPAIPNPRPATVITFNATVDDTFDPDTEAPTPTSHPLLSVGDILEFYYEE